MKTNPFDNMLLKVCLLLTVYACAHAQYGSPTSSSTGLQSKPQTELSKRNTKEDNSAQSTGFHHHGHHAGHHLGHGGHHLGHGHHGGGKFFMYAHQPAHKHYEFGFKRGNDKHVVERYEKGGPHHNFKSKFRWHDKHGGHGERYWDYNHAPKHHHDEGDASTNHHHVDDSHHHHDDDDDDDHYHDDGHGYHSAPVPQQLTAPVKETFRQRRKSNYPQKKSDFKKPTNMEKKPYTSPKDKPRYQNPFLDSDPFQPSASFGTDQPKISGSTFDEMLSFDPFLPPDILKSPSLSRPATTSAPSVAQTKPYYSRNFKPKKKMPKKYRPTNNPKKFNPKNEMPNLAFDLDSGRVYDEKSGKWYKLVADS